MRYLFFNILAVLMPLRGLRRAFRKMALEGPETRLAAAIDLAGIPKARGYMGLIQKSNLKLLAAFDALCLENNIEYFMIGGAVIGKIRHNGFIPWDDDVDVGMTEDNWRKLTSLVKKTMPNREFDIGYGFYWNLLKIIHRETGAFIDIFRFDRFSRDIDYMRDRVSLMEAKEKYAKVYKRKFRLKKSDSVLITDADPEEDRNKKWKFIEDHTERQKTEFDRIVLGGKKPSKDGGLIHFSGRSAHHEFFANKTIFPLKRHEFLGTALPFPNEIEDYAFFVWGDIWTFPEQMFHHGKMECDLERYLKMNELLQTPDGALKNAMVGK